MAHRRRKLRKEVRFSLDDRAEWRCGVKPKGGEKGNLNEKKKKKKKTNFVSAPRSSPTVQWRGLGKKN